MFYVLWLVWLALLLAINISFRLIINYIIKFIIKMKILLFTPFKVGSTTLLRIITDNFKYDHEWEHELISSNNFSKYDKNNYILRGHNINLDKIPKMNIKFDIWFTLVRNPYQLYFSTYFQNIDTPGYKYYLGEQSFIQKMHTNRLVDHFTSFKWDDFPQCSINHNFNLIEKYTGINLWNQSFNSEKKYQIYQGNDFCKKIVVLDISILNKPSLLNEMFSKLNFKNKKNDFTISSHNESKNKWYGPLYNDMKANLDARYFIKYYPFYKKINDQFMKKPNNNIMTIDKYNKSNNKDIISREYRYKFL